MGPVSEVFDFVADRADFVRRGMRFHDYKHVLTSKPLILSHPGLQTHCRIPHRRGQTGGFREPIRNHFGDRDVVLRSRLAGS